MMVFKLAFEPPRLSPSLLLSSSFIKNLLTFACALYLSIAHLIGIVTSVCLKMKILVLCRL